MRIDIISVVPALLKGPFSESIIKRAQAKGLLEVVVHDLHEFGKGKYRQVDDYPYGGGAGMVLMIEPMVACIESLRKKRDYDEIIFMTPDAPVLNQPMVNGLSMLNNILIIAGHFKGIDERIREHYVTKEISIGDYVLSGGELAAAVLVDAIGRILPGVIGDETSALTDSFQDGMLSAPVYTRPVDFNGWKVPDILLSGHHKNIDAWREEQAFRRTKERRPDLLK
ncbi:MAG TPA: tRNA (guanosine(37)-N1)-methyltransferase TrmD [Saprospiraceae bacterium]|nr:tRNA (guanosine(37)-N1)-methyltransferase TrmD [Saprospiraceae bacterium]